MKKVLWLIVCLMTITLSVSAQKWKDAKYLTIKETALTEFKSNLISPSQFVLTDKEGNRVSTDEIYISTEEEKIELDTLYYKWGEGYQVPHDENDSVIVYRKHYERCWVALIYGDAMNRVGGYKHTSGLIYVYGTEKYPYAYNKRQYKATKVSVLSKKVEAETEHFAKHTKGIGIPFKCGSFSCDLYLFDWIECRLCRDEWLDLGDSDYKKLVKTRRKCKEYKQYEKEQKEKRKEKDDELKKSKEEKFNKYLNM